MLRLACLSMFASLTLAACGQGEGDYCQVNDDCKGDLQCVPVTHTCADPGSTATIDGGEPDAKPVDANSIDATPAPDSTPAIDAAN